MAQTYEPSRHYLPMDNWPEANRLAWRTATSRGDLLDDQGRLAWLAARTIDNYRSAYGRWLTFLTLEGVLDPELLPSERVTSALVTDFIKQLQGQLAPLSVAHRLANFTMIRIGLHLLGHRHDRTADRYYVVADQRQAAQRWQAGLLAERRAARRRRREPDARCDLRPLLD